MSAVILKKSYKVTVSGETKTGPLMAYSEGLAVGVKTGTEGSILRRRNIFTPRYVIVRWDDATGYDITRPMATQFAGSTVNATDVILTVKTLTDQHSFTLKHTDPVRVRNQLGRYLAQIDARRQS